MITVDLESLLAQAALVRNARRLGFNVAVVLPPDQWQIIVLDARAEVMISAAGLTALTKLIDRGPDRDRPASPGRDALDFRGEGVPWERPQIVRPPNPSLTDEVSYPGWSPHA